MGLSLRRVAVDEIPGFARGTLGDQLKRNIPYDDPNDAEFTASSIRRVAAQEPQEPNPQRGASYYDKMAGGPIEVPYDPYESPQMTARRKAIEETWRSGKDAPEWSTEVSAMFPVSAASKRPAPDVGYGKEYNYSALDLGYVPPANTSPVRRVAPLPAIPSEQDNLNAVPVSDPVPEYHLPPALTMKQVGAPPTMIQANNKGRPVAIVGGNDPVEANRELIRAQEGYKAPRSTKDQILAFLTGGVPGGIAYATDQNTRNRWAVGDDVAREEGQIERDLGIESKQASVAAAKQRPVYQQQTQALKEQAQDEREINNALSQYNRMESYDPDDPSYESLKEYFKSRGVSPPKKLKGSNQIAVWKDGQLVIVDKPSAEARSATVDGQPITDRGRTPNEQGLTPNQQAGIDTRVSEGQKNRDAALERTKLLVNAVAQRQEKQIAAEIAKMGDPQEMYAAASELWRMATEKESQANSMRVSTTADAETKKQLLEEAAKLKETTVRIQQEAGKARSAGRVRQSSGLTEQQVRDAAKAKNLDPDEAVRRARSRRLIQ